MQGISKVKHNFYSLKKKSKIWTVQSLYLWKKQWVSESTEVCCWQWQRWSEICFFCFWTLKLIWDGESFDDNWQIPGLLLIFLSLIHLFMNLMH